MNWDWEEARNMVAWVAACSMLAVVAWAPVSCTQQTNAKIEALIQKGVDPVAARCAIKGQEGYESTCAILASKNGQAPNGR